MSNTPCAYAVSSVLHRSVEFKAKKRLSLVAVPPFISHLNGAILIASNL